MVGRIARFTACCAKQVRLASDRFRGVSMSSSGALGVGGKAESWLMAAYSLYLVTLLPSLLTSF